MNTRFAKQGFAALLLALAASASAVAAPSAEAQAQYRQERAACLSGQSHQDRTTCLREVSAAWAETRRGSLGTASTDYQTNATARCNAQPPPDRADCVLRLQGEARTEGSVNGGGLLRQVETPVN